MNNIIGSVKDIGVKYNVSLKVIDSRSGKVVQSHVGHNAATNSMLTGIGHYLIGNGVINQGYAMLSNFVPKYISLGTMGLTSQDEDSQGLPVLSSAECHQYMREIPGFGADGYDANLNNNRQFFGLGPAFANRPNPSATINCELISNSFPRSMITYRDIIPETEAEMPETIDIVFSAMISTGALAQFRESGKDYIFITEAGLWSRKISDVSDNNGDNGLLAAYRIVPPNDSDWDMDDATNRQILKEQILRVGTNQVVQVIWKIQLGSLKQLTSTTQTVEEPLYWNGV